MNMNLQPRCESLTEHLTLFNSEWNQAWLEKDVAAVEMMMADDYVYITPNGEVLDRGAVLRIIKSASYQLISGERKELIVRSLGQDVAAVICRWQGQGSYEGSSFVDDHRCTTICARRGTEWQVVHEHCSPNTR